MRDLLWFRRHLAAVKLYDEAGLLAWTAPAPSAAEVESSYAMLIETLVATEIDSAVGQVAVLRLVEHIVSDAALERGPLAADEMMAATKLLQRLRQLADTAVLGELVGALCSAVADPAAPNRCRKPLCRRPPRRSAGNRCCG